MKRPGTVSDLNYSYWICSDFIIRSIFVLRHNIIFSYLYFPLNAERFSHSFLWKSASNSPQLVFGNLSISENSEWFGCFYCTFLLKCCYDYYYLKKYAALNIIIIDVLYNLVRPGKADFPWHSTEAAFSFFFSQTDL